MNPIQLTVRNFMSYRDEVTLDFATLGIACLAGDNGAGKSALLDAITWAIWGKTRAASDSDVIALGAAEMDVSFSFGMHEREYRIFRRRSAGARMRQTLEFYARDPAHIASNGGGDWLQLTGDNVRQTEQKIIQTLNLDYETFVNSAFILQGRADSFAQKSAGERKKILSDILNLDEYDDLSILAREDERGMRMELRSLHDRITMLDRQLENRPQVEEELNAVSAELQDVSGKLDLAQQLSQALDEQLVAWKRAEESLLVARGRLEREQSALLALEGRLIGEERKRTELNDLLRHVDEIEHGAGELARWRAAVAEYGDKLRQVQLQNAIKNEAEREIDRAAGAAQHERERHEQHVQHIQKQLTQMERQVLQLEQLRREAAELDGIGAQLTVVRQTIEAHANERMTLHANNTVLRQRMTEIKGNIDAIKRGDAACPVCRNPLGDDEREQVIADWRADWNSHAEEGIANKTRIEEIERDLLPLQEDEQRLVALDRRLTGVLAKIDQQQHALEDRDRLVKEIAAAETDVARLAEIERAGDFAHEARARRAAAETALATIAYDRDAHDHATAQEATFAPFEERKRRLDHARIELEGVGRAIADLGVQIAERRQTIEETNVEIEKLARQLDAHPDLGERAQAARDDVEQLRLQRTDLYGRLGKCEHALEMLNRAADERDELNADYQRIALDAGAMKELVEAFGRNGIQAMIVENVLPELQDEANTILRRMSSTQLQVSFRSQREARSRDDVIETLDIIISDEYGERPYALYSGGEAFRINFAVRIALSKLLARRAGAKIDILVVDEGFGTQDSRGRDGLIEALRSIEEEFSTIIVITHLNEIRELFPTRIDVVKTERGSMISVN